MSSRRTIVNSNAASAGGIDDEDRDGCGDGAPRRRVVGMSPGTALLRVRCEMSSSSEAVAEIIADVPTLCNLLNSHIDELIEFHNEDDEDMDMEEDEAAAYEDGKNFVCLQLMHMARSSELHREEGSRRHFLSIMRRILARLATPNRGLREGDGVGPRQGIAAPADDIGDTGGRRGRRHLPIEGSRSEGDRHRSSDAHHRHTPTYSRIQSIETSGANLLARRSDG